MKKLVLLPVLVVICISAYAQTPGSLDLSFDPGDGCDGIVHTAAIQPDGKIIIGGEFTVYDGEATGRIARLNADGSLDESFSPGEGVEDVGQYTSVNTIAIQSDGKIIIGGNFTSFDGTAVNRIVRLNADGTLDGSFNVDEELDYNVFVAVAQPDGKIIIGGSFTTIGGTSMNHLARLNADGSLDDSFEIGTGAGDNIHAIALQPDGKIIIGGGFQFTSYNGTPVGHIARLNPDGTIDDSFIQGTGANNDVLAVVIQADGKIVIGGWFTSYDGTARNKVARLNADGTIDDSFDMGTGIGGGQSGQMAYTLTLQPDGKVIVGGWFNSFDGEFSSNIARLNADGSFDESFIVGSGADDWVWATAVQTDGNIVIGGLFNSYDGTSRGHIARLYGDASVGVEDVASFGSSIFPNPSNGLYTLDLNEALGNVQITVTDITGREVHVEQFSSSGGTMHTIDLSGRANGIYALCIRTVQGTDRMKLVKE